MTQADIKTPHSTQIKHILLDIEGTICPLSFVQTTLFPYSLRALPPMLAQHWSNSSSPLQPYLAAFPPEHRTTPRTLLAHVEDLTRRDVKAGYLKDLQGFLWREGYESGEIVTPLFADVVPALMRWTGRGRGRGGRDARTVSVYSSGSVAAQKLLFGHVRAAAEKRDGEPASESASASFEASRVTDETGLISEWFDTNNAGLKTDKASYAKIVEALGANANEVLFLTDNVFEVRAAREAGMEALLVDRPGNKAVSEEDRARYGVITSFEGLLD